MKDLKFNLSPNEEQLRSIFLTFYFKADWLPNDRFLNQFIPRDLNERHFRIRWISIQRGDELIFAFPAVAELNGTIVLAGDKMAVPFMSNELGAYIIFSMIWKNIKKFVDKSKYHDDAINWLKVNEWYDELDKFAISASSSE